MFRSKRIYHLHGKGITKNAEKNKINKLLYQFVFNNSYAVCLSDILSKDISMFHTKKNFVVNNGIKVIDSEEKRENVGIIQLLFLSNLIVEKGLFDFLEAIKYLKDIESKFYVTIIGEPFDISEKQLLEYIITNNLANVRYEGAKYGNEKHNYFKKPTIFIFPSRNDAFGLSIIEAMQFGITVIATNEGGIPDIIDDGINGFLIPKNRPEIIAEKIRFLLNNPIQRVKMGQNAKNKFFDRFTITHFEENMKNVFHEVITEN
jgi:glycosyltransferase involved in cell wall biosynthesis